MRTRLVLALLVLTAGTAPAAAKAPALRLLDRDPLVVRATGFAPGERVVVRASGRDGALVKRTRASRAGAFTMRFSAVYDYCSGVYAVRATGSKSGTVRLRPRPVARFCPFFE